MINTIKLKRLGQVCSGITTDTSENNFTLYGSTGKIGYCTKANYNGEYILVARVGANAGYVYKIRDKCGITDNTLVFSKNKNVNLDYLTYYLKQYDFKKILSGSGRPLITGTDLLNIDIFYPKNEEQEQIAKYLDQKTTKIQKTITKNKQLITLLKEKRTTLINQTVTKGLNPDVPMKDSGIEWIGEIPKHWKISKIKYFCDISMGQSPDSKYYTDDENYTIFIQGNADLKEGKVIPRIYTKEITKKANVNDLLLTVRAPYGEVAISQYSICIGRGVSAISNAKNRKFLFYYLINLKNYKIWELVSNGSTFESINYDDIINMILIEPPLEEQIKITNYLDNQTSLIDSTIKKIERNIELLEEYKESLIYHIVTGKIDVRGESYEKNKH